MHDQIVETCYRASQAACSGLGQREASEWRNGYAASVQSRLKVLARVRDQSDSATPASAAGTSLAVVNTALQDAMREKWGGPGKVKASNVSTNDRGRQAGMTANLPTNRPLAGAGNLRLR